MISKTTARFQSRGYRVDNSGRVTRRLVDMTTGKWGTKTLRSDSAAAKAAIKRANGKAAS